MDNMIVEVTYDYLDKHRTARGAWTKDQILALGLEWPLRSGWKAEVVGRQITIPQAQRFEAREPSKRKFKRRGR